MRQLWDRVRRASWSKKQRTVPGAISIPVDLWCKFAVALEDHLTKRERAIAAVRKVISDGRRQARGR